MRRLAAPRGGSWPRHSGPGPRASRRGVVFTMPNFEKLTIKSNEALHAARAKAVQRENPVVNDAHLLAALLEQDEGIVAPLLGKVGVNVTGLKADVEREIGRFPRQSGGGEPQV